MEMLIVLMSGVSAAVVSVVGNIVLNRLNRHDKKTDDKKEEVKNVAETLDAVREAVMYLSLDKIKFLGLKYIESGSVDYDDRRVLHKMHDNYHNRLGGNGDLDAVMAELDKLPLKHE